MDREEAVTVTIPAGVEEGMVLRVPRHGMPADVTNGLPGDLFVLVRTAADPRFTRHGADLWRVETVTVPEAVLGTKRTIPTLEGSVEVTIPRATQPGTLMRVAQKGLPEFGARRRGDLYLQINVDIPARLTKKERDLYTQLRGLEAAEKESHAAV